MINGFKILRRLMLCLFDILRRLFDAIPLCADERAYKNLSQISPAFEIYFALEAQELELGRIKPRLEPNLTSLRKRAVNLAALL